MPTANESLLFSELSIKFSRAINEYIDTYNSIYDDIDYNGHTHLTETQILNKYERVLSVTDLIKHYGLDQLINDSIEKDDGLPPDAMQSLRDIKNRFADNPPLSEADIDEFMILSKPFRDYMHNRNKRQKYSIERWISELRSAIRDTNNSTSEIKAIMTSCRIDRKYFYIPLPDFKRYHYRYLYNLRRNLLHYRIREDIPLLSNRIITWIDKYSSELLSSRVFTMKITVLPLQFFHEMKIDQCVKYINVLRPPKKYRTKGSRYSIYNQRNVVRALCLMGLEGELECQVKQTA